MRQAAATTSDTDVRPGREPGCFDLQIGPGVPHLSSQIDLETPANAVLTQNLWYEFLISRDVRDRQGLRSSTQVLTTSLSQT